MMALPTLERTPGHLRGDRGSRGSAANLMGVGAALWVFAGLLIWPILLLALVPLRLLVVDSMGSAKLYFGGG